MAAASMPATRTATASARCTSTPWRVSGHCSAPGCVRIAASRRRSCQSTSASLGSCTTRAGAEKPCSVPLSLPWSGDVLHHPGSRQEPPPFVSLDTNFFPHQFLGAACAAWSVRTAVTFLNTVYERLEIISPLDPYRTQFEGL